MYIAGILIFESGKISIVTGQSTLALKSEVIKKFVINEHS
jgi:hypothetical protein